MLYLNILGYLAGILVVISLLPQVIRSWRTKSTKDLSLWKYVIYIIGLSLWITYAVLIKNGPVVAMNTIGLLLALSILYLKLRYK